MKKKSGMFFWEEYYVASASPESVFWHHASVWSVLCLQNKAQVIYVFVVSYYMQNNQQKGASGDTDGSANCLREKKKPDHKLCIKTALTNEIIIRRK